MFRFYGLFDFTRMGLRYTRNKLCNPGLDKIAAMNGVKALKAKNINSKRFLDKLRELNPDAIVSVSAPQIFRKKLLELPRLGCWNVHGGRLPRYRGMMPAFWTLFNGEKEGAITIHKMNSKLDDGEILYQYVYPIELGETLDHLIRRSKIKAAEVLLEALEILRQRDFQLVPNNTQKATYFTFPSAKDVKRFRRKGLKLI